MLVNDVKLEINEETNILTVIFYTENGPQVFYMGDDAVNKMANGMERLCNE